MVGRKEIKGGVRCNYLIIRSLKLIRIGGSPSKHKPVREAPSRNARSIMLSNANIFSASVWVGMAL